ncbi:MAG: hypothetical protein ACLVIY_08370 [Anaerobutyricum soehngenii]
MYLLLIDQLTKLWAVKVLKPIGSIPVIRNVLRDLLCGKPGSSIWDHAE